MSFRFLLSARWIWFALFVLALSAVCVRLGLWQWHKHDLRIVQNAVVREHFKADPVDLATVVSPGDAVSKDDEWTRVRVTGEYDTDHQVIVRFTQRDAAPGVDIVTPLVTASGDAVLVDRGWIGVSNNEITNAEVPPPPSGTVTVEGWLRPDSGAKRSAVTPYDEQVRAISSTGLAKHVGRTLYPGYVNLQDQQPEAAEPLAAEPKPDQSQGPHFFYAWQWWFFAALATFGWFYFAWSEAKERRAGTHVSQRADDELTSV